MNTCLKNKAATLCIMGVTATGKTDLAIAIADRIPCEIISADSAMVYRELNIGTAKPSLAIRQTVPHHLIDICNVNEIYTAGQFCKDAQKLINKIRAKGKIPVIVGGTMLYFHLLQRGISNLPAKNDDIRLQLTQQAQKKGLGILHQMLEKIDPTTAAKLHPNDIQRVQRALEIYYVSGKLPSELYAKQNTSSKLDCHSIILMPPSKTQLNTNIEKRFEKMLELGLIDEVDTLSKKYDLATNLPAFRSVGYRQVLSYLQGDYNYETMIEKALQATRRLAKHQLTWLNRWQDVPQFTITNDNIKKTINAILNQLNLN